MTKTHPSNVFEEEFALGYCPSQDNYDPNFIGPSWHDLQILLLKEAITEMYILFCGKAHSDGTIGGTGFGLVTAKDVVAVWKEFEKDLPTAEKQPRNPDYTPKLATNLLGLNVIPEHVTGIVVRKVR